MKLINLIVVALILFVAKSEAQTPSLKFGHINIQELIMSLPEKQRADSVLQNEARILQDRMRTMSEEHERKFREYLAQRETLPELIRATMEREIQDMEQRLQGFQTMAQQSLQQKEMELYQPILEKIQTAVNTVGVEQGLIYIFDTSSQVVLFHSAQSIDCAPFVRRKLGLN